MVVNDLLFVKTWKWNKRDRMKAQKTLFNNNNNNNNAICIAQIRRKIYMQNKKKIKSRILTQVK